MSKIELFVWDWKILMEKQNEFSVLLLQITGEWSHLLGIQLISKMKVFFTPNYYKSRSNFDLSFTKNYFYHSSSFTSNNVYQFCTCIVGMGPSQINQFEIILAKIKYLSLLQSSENKLRSPKTSQGGFHEQLILSRSATTLIFKMELIRSTNSAWRSANKRRKKLFWNGGEETFFRFGYQIFYYE